MRLSDEGEDVIGNGNGKTLNVNVTWAWVAGALLTILIAAGGLFIADMKGDIEQVAENEVRIRNLETQQAVESVRFAEILRRLERIEIMIEATESAKASSRPLFAK
jgi:hypothetical protein